MENDKLTEDDFELINEYDYYKTELQKSGFDIKLVGEPVPDRFVVFKGSKRYTVKTLRELALTSEMAFDYALLEKYGKKCIK